MPSKQKINNLLNHPSARHFAAVNNFLAAITMISILGIVLETVPVLAPYEVFFYVVEIIAVFFFTLEYFLRLYVAPKRWRYVFSFFGIVDLLAILPTFLGMVNLTFLKSARVLRILRLLRMVRLAKVARLRRPIRDVEDHGAIFRLNIEIYFTALFAAVLGLGALVYVFEAPREGFDSIPAGMLWAADTVMGGSITGHLPQTVSGQLIGVLTRFVGLALLGVLIYVVGQMLQRWLLGDPGKAKVQTKNHH